MRKIIFISGLVLIVGYFFLQQYENEQYQSYQKDYVEALIKNDPATLEEIFKKVKKNAYKEKWDLLYSDILIKYKKDYPNAIPILKKIYSKSKNNNILISACMLENKLNIPSYKECYELILSNMSTEYYNDPNYWIAVGALNKKYSADDLQKSRIPMEGIKEFLNIHQSKSLEKLFPN